MSFSRPVITLTTDFGSLDPYVGLVKAVILRINPLATVIDITNDVQPLNILQASFLLGNSHQFFPPGTIHMVVVDPGVGSSRRPVILETPQGWFAGPDNGVLSYVLIEGGVKLGEAPVDKVELPQGWHGYHLNNPDYWLHPISSTFHGRDIFAPTVAHISLGVDPSQMGQEVSSLSCLQIPQPTWTKNLILGRIVHVDRFGNLITDISSDNLNGLSRLRIHVGGNIIQELSTSYLSGDWLLAIIGSYETLEIAVKNGSAAESLGYGIGDLVYATKPGGD